MTSPPHVIFGPQAPIPSTQYLNRLRHSLLNNPALAEIRQAVANLSDLWSVLVRADDSLLRVPGFQLLEGFKLWIEQGHCGIFESSSEIIATPLTILIQLVEYITYFTSLHSPISHSDILKAVDNGRVHGFCTGLLSAIALSNSKDIVDLATLGSVALRLAVCIGAYVDLDGKYSHQKREISCFSIHWRYPHSQQDILSVLSRYSDSYVSVVSSDTSVTVTSTKADEKPLRDHFVGLGFTVKKIGLTGRFHHSVHKNAVQKLQRLCAQNKNLRFPTSRMASFPSGFGTKSDDTEMIERSLENIAIKSILEETSDWNALLKSSIYPKGNDNTIQALVISPVDCIPRSFTKELNLQITAVRGLPFSDDVDATEHSLPVNPSLGSASEDFQYPDNAIAIVGMGCRFPGSDSLEEFWELLKSGQSMLGDLPSERFNSTGLRRTADPDFRYRGNFLRNGDAFDHRFFKKSSREAASMDPQHRLVLQVAYETLESAGYFATDAPPQDVGCYMGVAASDYEDNVASHMPTAFSVLGMVRAFTSGKISHFFGLNGPSLVFDTACSSSAVAIHTACKAVQNGECSMALAGGVNVITAPTLHQNLAAANFLSPTGESKAFDARADGYCRGEGAGIVLLKKLSAAVEHNDRILGVITGSAVNQNDNSAPITVPVSKSQANLYRRVLSLADMDPRDISYVEAHGTGTPKGDPIECASIRQVFGDFTERKLHFGSVKGSIGHTEAASGAAGLIKVLLMMQHGAIPKQASFQSLNPSIPPLEPSNMAIPTKTVEWPESFKAACINNYGAAGSNAALLVCQPPQLASYALGRRSQTLSLAKYPFSISASSSESLRSYCKSLKEFINTEKSSNLLANIAFNQAHKQNLALPYSLNFTAPSLAELQNHLTQADISELKPYAEAKVKPVVLVFSGQSGRGVSLSKEAYDNSSLLRSHLDHCDSIIRSMGHKSIFPEIFSQDTINDVVHFHGMIFSIQYSVARSWIDCGLPVKNLIGHSFGQLTAFAVASAITLTDALKLVLGRATLIKSAWGPETGAMLSVNSDFATVSQLISALEKTTPSPQIDIACYNGPQDYVLVGSEEAISMAEDVAKKLPTGPVKARRLEVTHGFHSEFVDAIIPGFNAIVRSLSFSSPTIPVETCSKNESWAQITHDLVVNQSREPVYFHEAVMRIENKYGPCNWVEAGSGTPAMALVRRALSSSAEKSHVFHPVKLGGPDAMASLAKTTLDLWENRIKVQFFPFHSSLRSAYTALNLPPYHFDKSRHWLEYIDKHDSQQEEKNSITQLTASEPTLVSFVRFADPGQNVAEFTVDQASEQYKSLVSGHAVLESTLCPASLYVEIAAKSATLLKQESASGSLIPKLSNLEMYAPLGIDASRNVTVKLTRSDSQSSGWEFMLMSHLKSDISKSTKHASAYIALEEQENEAEFERYERLVDLDRCSSILQDDNTETMQGSIVYKTFAKVVNYSQIFRGVKKISFSKTEVAGKVEMPQLDSNVLIDSVTDPLSMDNFTQVAGLHVNGLDDCGPNEVFLCTKIDKLCLSSSFRSTRGPWMVYSKYGRKGEKELVNDVFVFDSSSSNLVAIILGIRFTKVAISSLRKALSRANQATTQPTVAFAPLSEKNLVAVSASAFKKENTSTRVERRPTHQLKRSSSSFRGPSENDKIQTAVKQLLQRVADVPIDEIKTDSSMDDLGIDSLMATELLNETRQTFNVDVSVAEFSEISSFGALCKCITSKQGDLSSSSSSVVDKVFDDTTEDESGIDTGASTPFHGPDADDDYFSSVSQLSKVVLQHLDLVDSLSSETNLGDAGFDSLIGIEIASDIEKNFGVKLDMSQLTTEATFGQLSGLVFKSSVPAVKPKAPTFDINTKPPVIKTLSSNIGKPKPGEQNDLTHAIEDFQAIRDDYHRFASETGWAGFRTHVYPFQSELVLAYIVEAFERLGCSLRSMKAGDVLPRIPHLDKHDKVVKLYHTVLSEASFIRLEGDEAIRTNKVANLQSSRSLYEHMIQSFPQHYSELKLLNSTGSQLAECLTGKADPIQILFGTKADRDLLTDVYTNSPMFKTGTLVLGNFYVRAFSNRQSSEKLRILELGAGTGGTTKYIVDLLLANGIDFSYTFTDLSPSLVAAAKRNFASYKCMEFMVLDVEKPPPAHLLESYHTILSSNCVHATKDLLNATRNTQKLLRKDGFLCLLELTRDLYWLDCVFGLLEGWWLFNDGRKHVLANEYLWQSTLMSAGFGHVDWSDDSSEESDQFRVITAFKAKPTVTSAVTSYGSPEVSAMETVEFERVDGIPLHADIYYPADIQTSSVKRPVALMIHGGGHIMLSRKDIRPKQTRLLLDNGLVPISVDYRLCPEVPLREGPMTDVCTALEWIYTKLPGLKRQRKDIVPDCENVVVVGWSTGGTLAMSLAWTAPQRGLRPPQAILAFYCPSDYEDPFWAEPNFPERTKGTVPADYDLLEGVQDTPITSYNVPASKRAVGGWMSTSDPRSRIALHMNWKGQALPVLLGGLPSKASSGGKDTRWLSLPQPAKEKIAAVSPYAQIKLGNYRTPTFLIHGTEDDLIPWQHSNRIRDALREAGVASGTTIVEGAIHLFDLYRDREGEYWKATAKGYEFLLSRIGLELR